MSFIGPSAVNQPTFRTIERRLDGLFPSIKLRNHIVENPKAAIDLEVHTDTLKGVDFSVRDPDAFVHAIRSAKYGSEKAFKEGSTKPADWKQHWAMSASLLATKGVGFREPWRFELSSRGLQIENALPPIRLNAPRWDNKFAQHFGAANTVNLTALHISVAYGKGWTECNIHIDETGIGMVDMLGNFSITPGVFNHSANELIFKTILGKHLPLWVTDRVNLHVLSPEMGYERIGLGFDIAKRTSVKVTVTASCSLMSCRDIEFSKILKLDSGVLKSLNPTLNISGTF